MNDRTVGTCSICGGAVTVPGIWGGIIPPTPTCSPCGAVPAQPHGPVIQMKPRELPFDINKIRSVQYTSIANARAQAQLFRTTGVHARLHKITCEN